MASNSVVADRALLYRLLTRRRRRVSFSGRAVRLQARRGTVLAETALESVQDVTIRRGWFASTLTVQTVQGAAFKVRGLNRHQASYVRGAMLDAAAVRAAAAAQELVKVDEALHRLLQRGLVSGGREPPLYLVERLWRGSVGAGCSPRRVGLYPPVT